MPLYVYACPRCGAHFERLVALSRADEDQACPARGSQQTRRAITAAATIVAGRIAVAPPPPRSGIT
ncbi:MAG TPA: zinc ribbon domain-containing protein [Chloroflexota bacterium]|nr:zinc ribbon domain-containing protein [Chloroflexota bacterium]